MNISKLSLGNTCWCVASDFYSGICWWHFNVLHQPFDRYMKGRDNLSTCRYIKKLIWFERLLPWQFGLMLFSAMNMHTNLRKLMKFVCISYHVQDSDSAIWKGNGIRCCSHWEHEGKRCGYGSWKHQIERIVAKRFSLKKHILMWCITKLLQNKGSATSDGKLQATTKELHVIMIIWLV